MKRAAGFNILAGVRITKRNALWMIWIMFFLAIIWLMWKMIIYTFWGIFLLYKYMFLGAKWLVLRIKKKPEELPENQSLPADTAPAPISHYNHEQSVSKGRAVMPAVPEGFTLKHEYDDVRLTKCKNEDKVGIGSIVRFEHEPHNQHDKKAVAVKVENFTIGYLQRGNLRDMYNDFTSRGDIVIGCVRAFELYQNYNLKYIELLVGFCTKDQSSPDESL